MPPFPLLPRHSFLFSRICPENSSSFKLYLLSASPLQAHLFSIIQLSGMKVFPPSGKLIAIFFPLLSLKKALNSPVKIFPPFISGV